MGNDAGGRKRLAVGLAAVLALGLGAGTARSEGPPWDVISDWTYYNNAGWRALDRGDTGRAEQAFGIAIERIRPYMATHKALLGRSYADLARVLEAEGRHDEAQPLARWALTVREEKPGKNAESLRQNLELLARIERSRRRPAEAEPILRRLIALQEATLGTGHHELIPTVEALAGVCAEMGKTADAEPLYRRGLALREANTESNNREAESLERTANVIRSLMRTDVASASRVQVNRSTEVQRLETSAVELKEKTNESAGAAATMESFSVLLRKTGRGDEADSLEVRAKAIRDAIETRAARARLGR